MKKVLVVIPHFNKLILLKECLRHLDSQTYDNFDVCIVDNGSNDGSPEYIYSLSKNQARYKSILLDKNMGFAYAVNRGIEYAIDNGYEHTILLNNDAYVEEDFVKALVYEIDKKQNNFAVSSLMINYHDDSLIDSFGDQYSIVSYAFQNHIAEKVSSIDSNEYCFSACGGASIYRNSIFKEIGLFDEKFFCYLEDVDISYRAKLYGHSISTCKDAICYHLGSATSGSKYNEFKVRLSARNNIYLLYKNMPIVQFLINIFPISVGIVVKQVFFIIKGFGLDYFFGIFDGIKTLNSIKKNDFKLFPISTYIIIEIELIINFIKYIINFIKRHLIEE